MRIRQTVDRLRAEEQRIAARQEEIHTELNKPKRQIDGQTAWAFALENEDVPSFNSDTKTSLQEEYQINEGRLRFISEALATGTMELDKAHGKASLEICCKEARPDFIPQIKKLLGGIRSVCEANEALESMRAELVNLRDEQETLLPSARKEKTFDEAASHARTFLKRENGTRMPAKSIAEVRQRYHDWLAFRGAFTAFHRG